jgi:mRNA-degrading endonuclease RelE of RelBE toxin-antitoxin system
MRLIIHEDAQSDLSEIANANRSVAADLLVALQELDSDPDLLDRLTQHKYGSSRKQSNLNISKWLEHWNAGKDLWRMKYWDKADYRIIYAFIPATKEHFVLAVVDRRHFNYEQNHPITKRILRAYETITDS